jgi:hypothetical protein
VTCNGRNRSRLRGEHTPPLLVLILSFAILAENSDAFVALGAYLTKAESERHRLKRPFGGPEQVLQYLGRYTHRVAIANSRLLACENGCIRFRWKDYRANNKFKVMTLEVDEFIRRFLLHALPKGFRRIRHFGFLANACRAPKLVAIRATLQVPPPQPSPAANHADYRERYAILTGHRIDQCPVCGGKMIELGPWPRSPSPTAHTVLRHFMTTRIRHSAHHCAVVRTDVQRRNEQPWLQNFTGVPHSPICRRKERDPLMAPAARHHSFRKSLSPASRRTTCGSTAKIERP